MGSGMPIEKVAGAIALGKTLFYRLGGGGFLELNAKEEKKEKTSQP